MSNNPVRLQSGDGIPITQTDNALDVNIAGGVAVTGPLTDAQLTTQALAKESTLGSIKTAAESLLEKVQLHVAIDFSSASAQTIIAAQGVGKRIRLTRLSLVSGSDPQVNVEIALKSGATTIETVKGAAMVFDYPEHRNLGTNEAFVVQCTSADRVIGGVDYYVEVV